MWVILSYCLLEACPFAKSVSIYKARARVGAKLSGDIAEPVHSLGMAVTNCFRTESLHRVVIDFVLVE